MSVPTSKDQRAVLAVIAALEADADIVSAFKIQDPALGDSREYRIRRQDMGNAQDDGPRLCITTFRVYETVDSLGEAEGTFYLDVKAAAVIYVAHDPLSDRENEKDVIVNLTGLVRDKLHALAYLDGAPWYDIQMGSPSTQFDSSESFARSVTVFDISCRYRNNE